MTTTAQRVLGEASGQPEIDWLHQIMAYLIRKVALHAALTQPEKHPPKIMPLSLVLSLFLDSLANEESCWQQQGVDHDFWLLHRQQVRTLEDYLSRQHERLKRGFPAPCTEILATLQTWFAAHRALHQQQVALDSPVNRYGQPQHYTMVCTDYGC